MKYWRIINKEHDYRPIEGTYEDWKPHLRRESECRCVYCTLHDSRFGGQRNFHVEHFKPKTNKKFPAFAALENNYDNLFYACAVCNTFKSNSWFDVTEGDWTAKHFPDPSKYDYCNFFEINDDFLIIGTNLVGKFLVARFHLNRAHLVRERKLSVQFSKNEKTIDRLDRMFGEILLLGVDENILRLYQEYNERKTAYIKLFGHLLQNSTYAHGELR